MKQASMILLMLIMVGLLSVHLVMADSADKQFEQCRAKLKKAQQLDLLYDIKYTGAVADIFVGPTWYSIPLDAKEGFHDTVQCFLLAGKGGVHTGTKYRDWRSGKIVAEVSMGRLKIVQ